MSAKSPGDHDASHVLRIELILSVLLRSGVIASLAIIIFGVVLTFLHHPGYLQSAADFGRLTSPGAAFPRRFVDVWTGLRAGHGQAFVTLGLQLLIATPILRVAASIPAFFFQRDRAFVAITSLAFILLMLSLILGKVE